VRAQPFRRQRGHRRADAELARFVAGRGHDASPARTAHRHRLAAQRRIVALFDAGEEGIHVDMDDLAQPGRGLLAFVVRGRRSRHGPGLRGHALRQNPPRPRRGERDYAASQRAGRARRMTMSMPHDKRTIGQRELVVMVALLMSLNALAIDGMLPALDDMAQEMGVLEGNRRQLVVAVYLLANGLGCLVPGAFADRFGRRPLLLLSIGAYAVCSLVIAAVENFTVLLAMRGIQGLLTAGLMVVPTAIIRDRYEGDRMARLMSLVSAVSISVPVVAPSLGQAVLLFAGWRWIFVLLALLGMLAAVWVWIRLPETLDPANRQQVDVPVIVSNMRVALMNRASVGYVLGTMLLIGAVFGYVNSAQQLIGEHFGAGDAFPLVFGGTAVVMVFSNIVNSR